MRKKTSFFRISLFILGGNMDFITILFIGIGLAMDASAVSLAKGMGLDNRKAELQLANMLAKQGAARSTGRTNASFTPQTTASPISSSNYQTPTQADLKGISNILAERIKRGDLLY